MRVLVTGGAGFLGSFLCEKLLKSGHSVICADNFYTGRNKNIVHLMNNKNFEVIRHDIIEPLLVEVDWIFNLACPASPVHYQANPIKTIKTNFLGAYNVLGLAKRLQARVFQASTSEIYGDPLEHPQKETYWGNVNSVGLRSCYDEGKRIAESLFMDYHRQNKTDIRIVRIFNTYGPRMLANDGRVVSNFIVQALKNKDITVYGDGEQTRSFCYVDDLIEGFLKMMGNDSFIGPVNLGNPEEFKISELAKIIIGITNSSSKIIREKSPSDDPLRRKPDITLAREKLGWEPKVNLLDGLKKTIAYFEDEIKKE
jgi:UDP-glucuronate decarboxylase